MMQFLNQRIQGGWDGNREKYTTATLNKAAEIVPYGGKSMFFMTGTGKSAERQVEGVGSSPCHISKCSGWFWVLEAYHSLFLLR